MAKKCKDETRVHADLGGEIPPGDGIGVWSVIYIENGECRNLPGQRPGIFVLCRNGKPKMQMLGSLAIVLPNQLRAALGGGPKSTVRIRHTVLKIPTTFATLTPGAAMQLATDLEICVGQHL